MRRLDFPAKKKSRPSVCETEKAAKEKYAERIIAQKGRKINA